MTLDNNDNNFSPGIFPEPEHPAGAAPGDGGQVRDREDLHLHRPDRGSLHREVHQQHRQLLRPHQRELHPRYFW